MKNQQKIRFSGAIASHQNGSEEKSIKTVFTMARTTLMHSALISPEDTLSTDIWPMAIYYAVWIYNWIPDMQSVIYDIEIWSRPRIEPVSESLSN